MLHQIGIGTLGPVFRTYEPTRDRLVAVKVFRLDIVPEQVQALADALNRATESSLFHPSIVGPLAAGVEGFVAYRAEEYVAAESLDVAMRHYAPAAVETALPFITQLSGAIDFARAAGVGHGGLHPRDIFVTPDEARAAGFGVVEALEQVGIRAPIRRPYTAPERIDGAAWGTPADVFSLAAITFELLTARRPAGTGAQIGVLPESERSGALHAVLARAMDDDPSRRYATALAFAGALESAARGDAASAAVADVAAIAGGTVVPQSLVPESPVPAPSSPDPERPSPVASPAAQGFSPASTPGEFERGGGGDPVPEALDDVAVDDAPLDGIAAERDADDAHGAAPTLFDDQDEGEAQDVVGEVSADEAHSERFAEDFVEEELPTAARDDHAPDRSVYAADAPMFVATEPEPEHHDMPERSGPAILPLAVTLVLGLLGGFAAGYFVGSRDRLSRPVESAPAATAQPAPPGPATPERPGQYSEQKVTPTPGVSSAPAPAPGAGAGPAPAPSSTPPALSPVEGSRPARLPRTGQIVVRSTPSRAVVTVNGKWRGRTPLTLTALPFGTYVVRVVQDGFRVARKDVTLSARDASHTITARLDRNVRGGTLRPGSGQALRPGSGQGAAAAYSGSLYVDSRPRGATVLLDGRRVGVTPVTLAEVAIGSHVVRIEMAGRKPWTSTARVTAGKMERVTASLDDRP